jgi:hypothetical protein
MKLRRRLRPHGVEILTCAGQGYMLDPDHVPRLDALLGGASAAA